MRFKELQLNNWGPYLGSHQISFDSSTAAPVIVIHGENGRGKTSLIRAIYWCLYGRVLDSYGIEIPVETLVSLDATESGGEFEFGSTLVLDVGGKTFEVSRVQKARAAGQEVVLTDQRFVVRETDKAPLSESIAKEFIAGLLDEAIADFYLFDGEKLAYVEKKLSRGDSDGVSFVRRSVEKALGLTFADRLRSDLEEVMSVLSNRIAGQEKLREDTTKLVKKREKLSEELDGLKKDHSDLSAQRADVEQSRDKIINELQNFALIRDKAVERQLLIDQVAGLKESHKDLQQELRDLAEKSWAYPLAVQLDQRVLELEGDIKRSESSGLDVHSLNADLRNIRASLEASKCELCGVGLDKDKEHGLQSRLAALESKLSAGDVEKAEEAKVNLSKLAFFTRSRGHFETLELVLKQIGEKELSLVDHQNKIKNLTNDIGTDSPPDILALERDRERCIEKIAEIKNVLDALEAEMSEKKTQISSTSTRLKDSPDVNPKDRMSLDITENLTSLLSDAWESFRERMRLQVEESSSEMLKRLSSEKEYERVSITPAYEISMIDHRNRSIPALSSGYAQILALAFISGLAEVAGSSNPVVMDTPWGRVDRGNRALILDWISRREKQTIIFVQSGELTMEEARQKLGGRLGRQLQIERLSATTSKITEVR